MPIALFQHIVNKSFLPQGRLVPYDKQVQRIIKEYYIIRADALKQECLAFSDGIPTIAIFSEADSAVTVCNGGKTYCIKSAWLSSQYLENTYLSGMGRNGQLLIIRFNPVIFYQTFGIVPQTLRKKAVWSLPEALGVKGELLLKHVRNANTINEQISTINLFVKQLPVIYSPNCLLVDALVYMDDCKGQTTVSAVAKKLKVNYKWLERNFVQYVGITPKEYLTLQRFKQACFDLTQLNVGNGLLTVAVKNGYYDANHMLKDFKRFTGTVQYKRALFGY